MIRFKYREMHKFIKYYKCINLYGRKDKLPKSNIITD